MNAENASKELDAENKSDEFARRLDPSFEAPNAIGSTHPKQTHYKENDEYQKKSLEMDPVMNIRFPRAFAAAKTECQRRTYHFYTQESFQLFEEDPSEYTNTV